MPFNRIVSSSSHARPSTSYKRNVICVRVACGHHTPVQMTPGYPSDLMGLEAVSQVLGLQEGAPAAEVRRAFRRGAHRVHPDKCALPGGEAAFKLLAAAADHALAGNTGAEAAGGAGCASLHPSTSLLPRLISGPVRL